MSKKSFKRKPLTGESFEALPEIEKQRIFQELEDEDPADRLASSKPLTKKQRAEWNQWKRRGRQTDQDAAKAVKVVALKVEQRLLEQTDAYAKTYKLKRSDVVAQGLRAVLGLAS